MWRSVFIVGFLLAFGVVTAQQTSIETKPRSVLDSLHESANRQWLTDSLSITAWGDSLRQRVTGQATNKVGQFNHQIDSLTKLQLPTEKYTQKLDSIQQKSNQLLLEINQKQQQLLGKSKVNMSQWQDKLKLNVGQGINLPTGDLKIPELNALDFQVLELSPELTAINKTLPFSEVGGLNKWKSQLPDLGVNVPSLKDYKSNPNKFIETAATNIDGVQELKNKLDAPGIDQTEFGKLAKDMQNPEALKQVAVEQVKKEAINHFAGKEEALQAAMEQISKYKQKYESVSSLSEVKNLGRPYNPMKGKPFRERFVPGFAVQIHTRYYLNFDIYPNAYYKFSGRLNVGLGWNQRFAMDWTTKAYQPEGRVLGPRTYLDIKLPRGFLIRQEFELLNSYIPPLRAVTGESGREWVFSTMTGLKKDYKFFNRVKGFTVVQFDLLRLVKPSQNSPYADVVNTRFGFEFPMKKKVKTEKKAS